MDYAIRRLGRDDAGVVMRMGPLFDYDPLPDATTRFLADEQHHLLAAFDAGEPVGFVSGVETTHPDKGTEMFLYELAVLESHRRRGIGRALVDALAELARERGCYGMWVLTDHDNDAALPTYGSAGGHRQDGIVMFDWEFDQASQC
jgi:ribosomal protein S18 acetylase RimI-like enzyme